jgi:predicted transcriptional regulator
MATKTSAYGEEAKVLLIRELTPEVLEVLKWYKGKRGITANTVAALEIIAAYRNLYDQHEDLKRKYLQLDDRYDSVIDAIKDKLDADEKLANLVDRG